MASCPISETKPFADPSQIRSWSYPVPFPHPSSSFQHLPPSLLLTLCHFPTCADAIGGTGRLRTYRNHKVPNFTVVAQSPHGARFAGRSKPGMSLLFSGARVDFRILLHAEKVLTIVGLTAIIVLLCFSALLINLESPQRPPGSTKSKHKTYDA